MLIVFDAQAGRGTCANKTATMKKEARVETARNNFEFPPDLLDLIEKTASAEGRRPEQVVQDAMGLYVSTDRWQRVLAYGKRQAQALGYTEDDVERLIEESRSVRDRTS